MNRRLVSVLDLLIVGSMLLVGTQAAAAPLVPGTGQRVAEASDDFEESSWEFVLNLPKSSANLDGRQRPPLGLSRNNRWNESRLRGTPDIVQRVPTPPGGLAGSQFALLLRSRDTGVPGAITAEFQQDDLLMNGFGMYVPVAWSPSVVVRVYLPPFDEWEDRTGTSFGLRANVQTTVSGPRGFFSRRAEREAESFYPGLFIYFFSKTDGKYPEDTAQFLIRADGRGQDIPGPRITQTGWWTLGLSFTPDGQVHYFAKPGIGELTLADHLGSHFPYGHRCEQFHTIFFNIASANNGRLWSTPWVIDDPTFYSLRK